MNFFRFLAKMFDDPEWVEQKPEPKTTSQQPPIPEPPPREFVRVLVACIDAGDFKANNPAPASFSNYSVTRGFAFALVSDLSCELIWRRSYESMLGGTTRDCMSVRFGSSPENLTAPEAALLVGAIERHNAKAIEAAKVRSSTEIAEGIRRLEAYTPTPVE